ncbi:MAG TPA: MFS transporter [Polyangiaceae bacterium]|nr:MFS transporter [Polyangiaceae bacterium]
MARPQGQPRFTPVPALLHYARLSLPREKTSLARALRHRNYRLFFAGQSLSLIGTWLTRVATSWLVYRLTGSAVTLGVTGFAGQIPTFLVAPFAGVWVDRWDRHRVLVVTQALAMLQSAALAALSLSGRIDVPSVIFLSAFQGVINAFDVPARQSFVVQMVDDRADLPNAIALNSSMVNAARLLGPSIGGILISLVGEGSCFAIDAVSYLAVLASLLAMRVEKVPRAASGKHLFSELADGFRYTVGFSPIRNVLLLMAVVSFVGMPYTVLMPVVATRTLGGGAHTLGFLMAASGVGALSGTLYLASRTSVVGLGRVIALASACFGIGLLAFSRSHSFWLSCAFLVPTGLGMMVQLAASNTVLQTLVDEDKRGRVMSFYTMSFFGTVPFGSLFAGVLADRIGAEATIAWGGACCVLGALSFLRSLPALRRLARPIYERLGILPPIEEE